VILFQNHKTFNLREGKERPTRDWPEDSTTVITSYSRDQTR